MSGRFFASRLAGSLHTCTCDYRWDGDYDLHCGAEQEQELLAADLQRPRAFIEEDEWIRYDSFIAPAVARGHV